jgi:hypothetical protein
MKDKLKKIAALTGSAVMLGATMLGAVAVGFDTFTAKNGVFYTTGGELNAFVGIGTGAAVSDVAGAIDVAGAMAQAATIGGEEGAIVERNVTAGVLYTSGETEYMKINSKSEAVTFTPSSTGFDWLYNSTGTYTELESGNRDTTDYSVFETITTDNCKVDTVGKFGRCSKDDSIYNVTTNGTALLKGMDKFKFVGVNYQIVDYGNQTDRWVKLGVLEDLEKIPLNTKTDIGDSGASFEIVNKYYDGTNQWVTINFYDEDDNLAAQEDMKVADEYDNDTLGITVSIQKIADYEIGGLQVDLQYETTGMLVEHGEDAEDFGVNAEDEYLWVYDVGVTTNGVNYIALRNTNEYLPDTTDQEPGTYAMLGGYFNYYYKGLTIDSTEEEETNINVELDDTTFEISFKDENETSVTVDLTVLEDDWDSNNEVDIEPQEDDFEWLCVNNTWSAQEAYTNVNVTLPNNTVWPLNGSGTYMFDWVTYQLTWNDTAAYNPSGCEGTLKVEVYSFTTANKAGYLFDENLTFTRVSDTEATLVLTEPDSETVTVNMDNTTKGWYFEDPGDIVESSGFSEGSSGTGYSLYGTQITIEVTDDEGTVTLTYPEAQRFGEASIGLEQPAQYTLNLDEYDEDLDLTLISGGGSTVKEILTTGSTTASGIAKLDTEYASNAPVVLIGGPVANSKVQSLVTAEKALQNITAGGPEASHAYVEYVEDAFGTYDAVIIAGYGATETRLACRVFASQILHGTPLTTFAGTQLNLNFAEAGGDFKLVASEDW